MSATAGRPVLIISDFEFARTDRERVERAVGQDALLLVRGNDALRDAIITHPHADVVASFFPPEDLLAVAPALAWLALPSAGADYAVSQGMVKPGGPIVTDASGVHAVPIGEFVLSVILLWSRQWPKLFALQRRHEWPSRPEWQALRGRELRGATVGIIGLGAIGRSVAQLTRGLGMRVLATRRSATAGSTDPDVDHLVPASDLHSLLGASDFVVLSVPSTPETHHMIGERELRAMRPTAFLINISRGEAVDQAALIAALQDGTIAGAGLDVFEHEPLPPESPLWSLPNVIISPHLAGASNRYSQRFTDLFLDNLARFQSGVPLRNVVDPTLGY